MMMIAWLMIGILDARGLILWDYRRHLTYSWVLDLGLSCLVILAIYSMDEKNLFRRLLAWMGQYTLGAYLGEQLWFVCTSVADHRFIPDLCTSVLPGSIIIGPLMRETALGQLMLGLAKLMVLLAYPFAHMLTIAPLFQKFCLLSFICCERVFRAVRAVLCCKSAGFEVS